MTTKVVMPEMGEGVTEGTVSQWLKQEGDAVAQYEPILEIETDKVTTEATAETAGTLLQILVHEGETVPVGTVLALIGSATDGSNGAEGAAAGAAEAATAATAGPYTGRISPVVGRIAGEHNVELSQVTGTGRDGRITKKDILAYIEARKKAPAPAADAAPAPAPPAPALEQPAPVIPSDEALVDAPTTAAESTMTLSAMRRRIAEHMVRSKHTSAHVTTIFEIDFSAVVTHRQAHRAAFAQAGANLTYTAYLVAATVEALKQHPLVNSSWSDEGIVQKQAINVGIATAIEAGLIVPVIKQADGMNLLGLARAINDLTERARDGRLSPTDVRDGTFTITNHGTSGSLFATPIINQPQCGILGVGKIEKRVKVIDDAIAIRPLAYVGLTFDHRILDGAGADAFVNTIKDALEGWR